MPEVGNIVGSAFVEIKPEVSAFESTLQQALTGPMQRQGSMMGKIFTGAAVGLAGIATGAIAAVNHTIDLGQAAYEMGEKFGLSGRQASTFIAIGKLVGVSSDQMGIGMRTLSKQLNTTAIDLKNHASAATLNKLPLQELGIASTDASGNLRDMGSVLSDIADKFHSMPDGPQKAALATQLFGRAGTDLIPILDEGSKGLADLTAQAQAEGAVMSGPQVEAAHQAYLAHQKLNEALSGVALTLGSALMPYLAEAANWMSTNLPKAINTLHGWIETHRQDIDHWANTIKEGLIAAFHFLSGAVGDALSVLTDLGGFVNDHIGVFENLAGVLATFYGARKVGGFIGGLIGDLQNVLGLINKITGLHIPGAPGGGGGGGGLGGVTGMRVYGGPVEVTGLPVTGGGIPGVVGKTGAATVATAEGEAAAARVGLTIPEATIAVAAAAALTVGAIEVLNVVAPEGFPKNAPRLIGPTAITPYNQQTYANAPGHRFAPPDFSGMFSQFQGNVAEIIKDSGNIPHKFDDLAGQLSHVLVSGSRLDDAMVDIAALTKTHVITNGRQLQQYDSNWNQIQDGAIDTKGAQWQYAELLAEGKIKLGTPLASFIQSWNVAKGSGLTFAAAQQVVAASGGLAAKSGQAFASGVAYLAQQTGGSINQIISAYTLTASFAANMIGYQEQITGLLARGVTLASGVDAKVGSIRGLAGGGILTEPVSGVGQWTGQLYRFAEAGTEFYGSPAHVPASVTQSGAMGASIVQHFHINGGNPAEITATIQSALRDLELTLRTH